MTEKETRKFLAEHMQRESPELYKKIQQANEKKKQFISDLIDIACSIEDEHEMMDKASDIYTDSDVHFTTAEEILIEKILRIKHKEHINKAVVKDDQQIQYWLQTLLKYREYDNANKLDKPVFEYIDKLARGIINQYLIRVGVGRPKGKGLKIFKYNGKEYHTIQECADDYGITRQGMHKRLKKQGII